MEPRLIDANALKEHISSFTGRFTDDGGFEVSMDAVLNAIDFAETIDAEPKTRWFSVKKQLPEYPKLVLALTSGGEYIMARYGSTQSRKEAHWYAYTDGITLDYFGEEITHWRYLPKKPGN